MTLDEARSCAEALLDVYGLTGQGWTFQFNKRKVYAGLCIYETREIQISQYLVELNPDEVVEDTIRHEVAHALAPGDQHGPIWRDMCKLVGAEPRVFCPRNRMPKVPARYETNCDECGKYWDCRCKPKVKYYCDCGCQEPLRWQPVVKTKREGPPVGVAASKVFDEVRSHKGRLP